jgi:hypothetical protein
MPGVCEEVQPAADGAGWRWIHSEERGPLLGLRDRTLSRYFTNSYLQYCGSGSGALFGPWIRNPGWVKSKDPGSGMNKPDHIS